MNHRSIYIYFFQLHDKTDRLYCTDDIPGPAVSVTSPQCHILLIFSWAACFQRDDDVAAWKAVHPTRTTWFEKNWLSQNAAGFVCKETPLGLGWQREEEKGRGHHQKELAHAQYWESAIHSLSTGPFLSSLLSFTLMIVTEKVQQWKIGIREIKLCRVSVGKWRTSWTKSGGHHFRTAWQAC